MDLREKYVEAFEALDGIVKNKITERKFCALGYTSNLDFLCDFQVDHLNQLLEEHMKGLDLTKMQAAKEIHTMQDMLETIVYFCSNGIGGEVDVVNTAMVQESFPFTYGMGGTGVQAALALNAIGCPSLVHLTDDSKEVCDLLDTPGVYTVSQDMELVHTDKIVQTQEQEPHYIIQFKKGDVIRLGDQAVEIPCSNRLILTKITVNEFVPFYDPFFRWIEDHAMQVPSNVLSSVNAFQDFDILNERILYMQDHIAKYHAGNPDGIVFFEDAHYHDMSKKKFCLENLYSHIDIISLNEEELSYTLNKMFDFNVNINDIISCIEGAKFLRQTLHIKKGVVIHTKDYSMYVGEKLDADIQKGLMYGNLLATAKATHGSYGTREQVKGVLSYELSEIGVKHYDTVMHSEYADEVVLVPSKYMDRPKYTIGLGDSFIGGVQLCF